MSRRDGVIDLDAYGSPHKLHFTMNAMCEFEEMFGRSFFGFLSEFQAAGESISMVDLRRMMWVGLLEHHEGITEREAGQVATRIGGMAVAAELLGEALQAMMPDQGAEDAESAPEGKSQAA